MSDMRTCCQTLKGTRHGPECIWVHLGIAASKNHVVFESTPRDRGGSFWEQHMRATADAALGIPPSMMGNGAPINSGWGEQSPAVTVIISKDKEIARLRDALEDERKRHLQTKIAGDNLQRFCAERHSDTTSEQDRLRRDLKGALIMARCLLVETVIQVRRDMDGRYAMCAICRAEARKGDVVHKPDCRLAAVLKD